MRYCRLRTASLPDGARKETGRGKSNTLITYTLSIILGGKKEWVNLRKEGKAYHPHLLDFFGTLLSGGSRQEMW